MHRILLALFTVFVSFALITPDAEARRMGGGRSIGMQRSAAPAQPPRQPAAAPQQAAPQPAAAGAAGASKRPGWLGPVAGLAAGLGLAALASHLGFGEEMANFLMIALLAVVAFMAIRWLISRNQQRNQPRRQTGMQYAGIPQEPVAEQGNSRPHFNIPGSAPAAAQPANAAPTAKALPADFDEEAFLHIAKVTFIRMQAAHDAGNLNDLREFLSPELFAEVQLDLHGRNDNPQTEVIELNATLANWEEEGDRQIVSVRFSGRLNEDGSETALDEVWHLAREAGAARWVVAGIQQA